MIVYEPYGLRQQIAAYFAASWSHKQMRNFRAMGGRVRCENRACNIAPAANERPRMLKIIR